MSMSPGGYGAVGSNNDPAATPAGYEAQSWGRPWDIGKGFDHSATDRPRSAAASMRVELGGPDLARNSQRTLRPAEHDSAS